jgi:formylglycine-generating enzyme required for sulfatase activity
MRSLLLLLLTVASAAPAFAQRGVERAEGTAVDGLRVALVIGNAGYGPSLGRLVNPTHDAEDMAAALEELGFSVELKVNADRRGMDDAVNGFRTRVADAEVAVFYLAGHGIQVEEKNYLVLIGAKLRWQIDAKYMAVNASWIVDSMYSGGAKASIVIVGACRNNPLPKGARGGGRGLAAMQGTGALIAFAASSGQTADENVDKRNGLYTQELLKQLREPGLSVVEVFQRTREEVYSLSEERQAPEDWNRLVGTVVLKTGDGQRNDAAATSFTEPTPRFNAEDEIRELIRDSQMAEDFAEYLKSYPSGRYVSAAKVKLRAQERATTGSAVSLSAAPSSPVAQPPAAQKTAPKSETADLKAGQTFKDCADCPEMVVVPAGSFVMGSPANEQGHNIDEAPQHEVTIDRDFAVSKHEITQGQFALFVRESSRNMEGCWQEKQTTPSDQHPLVCVSWEDAKAYAQWLATKTGKPYRLLSEAEWEYAARASTTTSRFWGNDAGKAACEYANVYWCGAKGTAQVGRVNNKPNAFGLHDMLGNAYEWVEDCYFDSYSRRAPTDGSAWVSWSCGIRVLRGGSFLFSALDVRSANRYGVIPDGRFDFIGVRLARMLP